TGWLVITGAIVVVGTALAIAAYFWMHPALPSITKVGGGERSTDKVIKNRVLLDYDFVDSSQGLAPNGVLTIRNRDRFAWTNVTVHAGQHAPDFLCVSPPTIPPAALLAINLTNCVLPTGTHPSGPISIVVVEAAQGTANIGFEPGLRW